MSKENQVCIHDVVLDLVQGDITHESVDAIVNAANEGLCGGGGVDGAIHRAGGPVIMQECRQVGRCPTGQAVVTTAGNLPCRWVIHTVGPVWHGGNSGEPEALSGCYRNSLDQARKIGASSIAFASISTGVYGYPVQKAAPLALAAIFKQVQEWETQQFGVVNHIRFVLFDSKTYYVYCSALHDVYVKFS